MQIDLDKAHVFELFNIRDHDKIREMSRRGEKLFSECIAPAKKDPEFSVKVRVSSLLIQQQPHLGWNPPAEKVAGSVWW